jgi:hypothetical protein
MLGREVRGSAKYSDVVLEKHDREEIREKFHHCPNSGSRHLRTKLKLGIDAPRSTIALHMISSPEALQ